VYFRKGIRQKSCKDEVSGGAFSLLPLGRKILNRNKTPENS
jgi:hypothetical protein